MNLLLVYLLLLLPTYVHTATITGKSIKVLDDDTMDILYNNKPERIRFNRIDAPEKGQPHGQKAKQFVLDLAANKIVSVNVTDTDRYGRSVGEVILPDGRSLNRELVRSGYAWWYRKYSKDASLGRLEEEAKRARRGLWQGKVPMPPWEWRANKRGGSAEESNRSSAVTASGFHGNMKSGVFHKPSCEHFNCKN
jgi:endonuclease YncB( thermonuclease family)